jgi:adenylate cyclase class 2
MREIEIKARISNKQALLQRLTAHGLSVSSPITQRDRVFGLAGEMGGDSKSVPWLRIRTESKSDETKQIFTLKRSITNQMDSIEHETEVVDECALENIILQLGFTPYSDLTKTRTTTHIGEIELCIDTIDSLGDFIEAEKLTDEDADYDTVAEELWKTLEDLGVDRSDLVTDGYDVLMRKHQGIDV